MLIRGCISTKNDILYKVKIYDRYGGRLQKVAPKQAEATCGSGVFVTAVSEKQKSVMGIITV